MRIVKYLNTTKEEVEARKFNIWIGISLGNKRFTKEAIKQYIIWALEHTKEDVLVVIGDQLHAINLEILDEYPRLRAINTTLRKGDEKESETKEILSELSPEEAKLVKVVRFAHATTSKYNHYRLEVLRQEFKNNPNFHDWVISAVKENKKSASKNLAPEQLDKLAEYFLQEIPLYLNGAKYGGLPEHGGKTYLLQIYPGIGLIDSLLLGLQDGTLFPKLTAKLKITDKIALIEGYPE